jgi:drug/metabolite transporter (DMT)-like permease
METQMTKTSDMTALSRGVVTILATVSAMALADAVIKLSSAGMTLWQIWVLRSLFTMPVLLFLARGSALPPELNWVLLRSVLLALMYLGIYAAIPLLDLSVIAAALYTGPLFIMALSALVLKEPITGRQWVAISSGFAGVLVMVRPMAADFSPLALLPIGAAFLYAAAAVLTRARCSGTRPVTMALWLNLAFLVLGAAASLAISAGFSPAIAYPFLFGAWQGMGASDWQVIGILAALMIGIGIGLARAYQSPHPQVIATFDYAYLIFAAFWGYVFFGEVPGGWTIIGMTLIIVAGILVLFSSKPYKEGESR